MKNEKKVWDSRFLGNLDENSRVFVNKNGDVQFKIEIISNSPSDFPLNVKTVNGFSNSLEDYGYTDSFKDTEDDKINKVIEFLKGTFLIFSVREAEHSDINIEKKYYNSTELKIVGSSNLDNEETFYPIPIFFGLEEDLNEFLKRVVNEEYIGKNDSISLLKDDYPPFLIIGQKDDSNSLLDIEKLHIIGPITELQHKEKYGIKFLTDGSIKSNTVNITDLDEDTHFIDEGVIFLSRPVVEEFEKDLIKAEEIKINQLTNQIDIESKKIENIDELEFLETFDTVCKSNGLIYTKQDIYNFHTAMKTQSFVILAGMSGTGKSKMVECYHQAFYNARGNCKIGPERMKFIPVRPFWQDDSDLLGYLDTLNGIYRPGDSGLVDFILESNKIENQKECYFVCLDEMNLARVEHYFSQFLSILERDSDKRIIELYNPKMDGRIYNRNEYPAQLKLGNNLFFVGTVNIDESTYQFSDKVLDRANVINLSLENFTTIKNELEEYQIKSKETLDKLEKGSKDSQNEEQLNDRIVQTNTYIKFNGMKKEDRKDKLNKEELDLLWELHLCINKVNKNMGIGMRIVNQIEQYLMNLPESNALSRSTAFDLQISQRIFTKLRGSEGQLISLVGIIEQKELIESEINDIFSKYSKVSKFEHSINRLIEVSKELLEYGHTI